MDLPDILWCKNCRKFARVEGELNRQGLSNVCVECGANVDVIPYSEVKNTAYDGSITVLFINKFAGGFYNSPA